jgi:hypothetical protein
MASLPAWIQPGEAATLIWHSGGGEGPGGVRVYPITGPVFEAPPRTRHFLLAPLERSDFAHRLYQGKVDVDALRSFLASCVLARGVMDDSLEFVFAREETPVLPLLDAWRGLPGRPLLRYLDDIDAFLHEDWPVHVRPEAYATAQRMPESFGTAWVCEECEAADEHAVFLWAAHRDERVRACLVIENQSGVWTCTLHPFDFRGEAPLPCA